MKHHLNLRALAKATRPIGTSEKWFYAKVSNAMRGAVGELTDTEIESLQRALKKNHEEVMNHLTGLRKKAKTAKP